MSDNSQNIDIVPTKTDYAIATVKEVLIIAQLEFAASVIPVPFLKEAIGVALEITKICKVR